MCLDPATMFAIGVGLNATGAVVEGAQRSQAAKYNQAVALENRKLEIEAAARKETDARVEGRKALARQRVQLAKAGVDTASGSALDLAYETAKEYEYDALKIRADGQIAGTAYQRTADTYGHEAKSASRTAMLSAASDLFGGYKRWEALA